MSRLALGLDFGTESARALLLDCDTGAEHGTAVAEFAHGVMDRELVPFGIELPSEFALQHPQDYVDAMTIAVRTVIADTGCRAEDIVGMGVDFTACTPLPVCADGEPLCLNPRFEREPHAYVKLWKHHGAISEAERINEVARDRAEPWLARFGGGTSSEWLLAKLLETQRCAPAVLDSAARFVEASDWIVGKLAGTQVRGACAAGYKGLWLSEGGYPSRDFLAAVEPSLPQRVEQLLGKNVLAAGRSAGPLSAEWAARLGLPAGIAVSSAIIDAHAAVPGCGVAKPGTMVVICGTSGCHLVMDEQQRLVPGIQGVVKDGILPGWFGYEAGQAAMGDVFAWFESNAMPQSMIEQAAARGLEPLEFVSMRAGELGAGASGCMALDWFNGNRSILIDPKLSGVVMGLTIHTRPEEVFRALLEGVAFGTRVIVENFAKHGVEIHELVVTGGIAERNPVFLRVLCDVLGVPLLRAGTTQACARGAAILGAVAASGAGVPIAEAIAAMAPEPTERLQPDPATRAQYDALFEIYGELHDAFGRDPRWLHALRTIAGQKI